MTWTKSPAQNMTEDRRGWMKGKSRDYTASDECIVLRIHHALDLDEEIQFSGASAILKRYREQYPTGKALSLRFIGRILAKHNLSQKPKVKRKGVARYLHYPKESILALGDRLLELDFIGKKFIFGRTEPVNFIGSSLVKPQKLKHFQRVSGETADEVTAYLDWYFATFGEVDVVKLDNGFGFAGTSGRTKHVLSSIPVFLLKHRITPVFTAPRKPWNQASIEGSNSIFARKFWNRCVFRSVQKIDQKLKIFNQNYQWYCGFEGQLPPRKQQQDWIPRIYFIRKVYEDEQTHRGYIELANDRVSIPKSYINLFVLAEWNLKEQVLFVYFQTDTLTLRLIKKLQFRLNPKSKEKVSHFI